MYTGWRRDLKFEVNRPPTADEKRDVLSRDAAKDPSFDDRGGLVALNSTYIEWIDRRFRARGAGTTFGSLLVSLLCIVATVIFILTTPHHRHDTGAVALVLFSSIAFPVLAAVFFWRGWGIDFFTKVYWPIRFNRKNRMIYVYRDQRDGGILRLPWESVYFHIGYGMLNRDFCDIRGEVMEGKTVKDTFALGVYFPDAKPVREMWAFICRYMEGGPEAVGPDPRDRYVELSLNGTLRDCAGMMYTNYPPNINVATFVLGWPMIAMTGVTRWLVFKSCRTPRWPADVEAACKIEPGDTNVWAQPRYMNQFINERPEVFARVNERMRANDRRAWDAEPKSDLAKDMSGLESAWQQRDKR